MIRITKTNSDSGKFSMRLCFYADSTQRKNDETLLISKDGSPAVRIDEEIKTSKFLMETKNF